MCDLVFSTPADHSDFAIKWPWRPYASISQPHESFSTHRYKEKSALVKKIANVYEKPLPNDDAQRQFTGWQNAIFYSFDPIALRAIAPFPHVVKSIGDKAKTFGALVIHGSIDLGSASDSSSQLSIGLSLCIRKSLGKRDHKACIVTGVKGLIGYTRIISSQLFSADLPKLESVLQIADCYFNKSFRNYLHKCVADLRMEGDKNWNALSLSPDLRDLFEKGMIGFKPVCVAADRSLPVKRYLATFSFHVLERSQINCYKRAAPGDGCLDQMLPSADKAGNATSACEADHERLNACRLNDGKIIQIRFKTKLNAQKMLCLLALRWAAGSMWYLAGAAGARPDGYGFESESDTDLDDMAWIVIE